MPLGTLCPLGATFTSGIMSGALLAVSFLDARTFVTLADKKEAGLIKGVFPTWWLYGKAFMVPLTFLTTALHFGAFWFTGKNLWLMTMAMDFAIGPYTKILMMKDIKALMGGDVTGKFLKFRP